MQMITQLIFHSLNEINQILMVTSKITFLMLYHKLRDILKSNFCNVSPSNSKRQLFQFISKLILEIDSLNLIIFLLRLVFIQFHFLFVLEIKIVILHKKIGFYQLIFQHFLINYKKKQYKFIILKLKTNSNRKRALLWKRRLPFLL